MGVEPTLCGIKVRRLAARLPAHEINYTEKSTLRDDPEPPSCPTDTRLLSLGQGPEGCIASATS